MSKGVLYSSKRWFVVGGTTFRKIEPAQWKEYDPGKYWDNEVRHPIKILRTNKALAKVVSPNKFDGGRVLKAFKELRQRSCPGACSYILHSKFTLHTFQ